MIKRLVFDVVYENEAWYIKLRDSRRLPKADSFVTKEVAVIEARGLATDLCRRVGIPTQIVIHKKDGRIQEERTYPDETPRRKG